MLNIKRFLITIAVLCSANMVFADSCIMISESDITEIKCPQNSVICIKALTTLSNEKRSVIVTSLKDGECEFVLKIKNRSCTYKADVKNGKMTITGSSKIKILPVDLPPEAALPTEECNK